MALNCVVEGLRQSGVVPSAKAINFRTESGLKGAVLLCLFSPIHPRVKQVGIELISSTRLALKLKSFTPVIRGFCQTFSSSLLFTSRIRNLYEI